MKTTIAKAHAAMPIFDPAFRPPDAPVPPSRLLPPAPPPSPAVSPTAVAGLCDWLTAPISSAIRILLFERTLLFLMVLLSGSPSSTPSCPSTHPDRQFVRQS